MTRFLKTIQLLWTFYKSFLFVSLLVTGFCLQLIWKYDFRIFGNTLWLKLATLALIWFFINEFRSKEYYYYQNLGISKTLLWSATILFDLAIFIFLVVTLSYFK